jgi:hypothetical protein
MAAEKISKFISTGVIWKWELDKRWRLVDRWIVLIFICEFQLFTKLMRNPQTHGFVPNIRDWQTLRGVSGLLWVCLLGASSVCAPAMIPVFFAATSHQLLAQSLFDTLSSHLISSILQRPVYEGLTLVCVQMLLFVKWIILDAIHTGSCLVKHSTSADAVMVLMRAVASWFSSWPWYLQLSHHCQKQS